MPKLIIVVMEDNYPFGQCEEVADDNAKVLVRQVCQVGLQERGRFMEKIAVLRKLKNEHMIEVESVLEEEESIHFLFDYVPIKLETWISNINDQFIENFRDQLIKFSSFLANNFVKTQFQLRNIGMDQNYRAKYFLGVNFDLLPNANREKLKSSYIREITTLFRPYIHTSPPLARTYDSERERVVSGPVAVKVLAQSTVASRQTHDFSISPPTNRQQQPRSKEKALAQYYQQVNMSMDSENQKIMQEFMDVLDNEEEEEEPEPRGHNRSQVEQSPSRPQAKSNKLGQFPKYDSMESPTKDSSHYHQRNNKSQMIQNDSSKSQFREQPAQRLPQSSFNVGASLQGHEEKHIPSYQSMGRGRSEAKEPLRLEMRRESADLQVRVKSAIEKSLTVIRKFKSIRNNSLL